MEMQIEPSVIAATVIDRSLATASGKSRVCSFVDRIRKAVSPEKQHFTQYTYPQTHRQHAQSNDAQGGAPGKERKSAACVGARSPSFTHPAPNLKTSPVLALLF